MKLRLLGNINSGQFNAGDVADFADAEAQALIEAGVAEVFDGEVVAEQPAEEPAAPEAPANPAPLEQTTPTPETEKTKQPSEADIAKTLSEVLPTSSAQPSGN